MLVVKLRLMHYLIENIEQFDRLELKDSAYIKVIAGNDNCHPLLDTPSLVYYNNGEKGYMICVKHYETFGISFERIKKFLDKHYKIYVSDKKYHSYFLNHKNLIDLNYVVMDQDNQLLNLDRKTNVHHSFYLRYGCDYDVNMLIPTAKHYETCELEYKDYFPYFGKESNNSFLDDMTMAYKCVEESGIGVDSDCVTTIYSIKCVYHSMVASKLLGSYNLYNLTCRPTNSFNGINFLAIPKEGAYRKCFVADNYFVEFDFDAYHLRLIAKLIGYEFPKEESSIHIYFAKQYFESDSVNEEQYSESKTITFKQLYGGIQKKYSHIPFFQKTLEYTNEIFEVYKSKGSFTLPTGRILKFSEDMTPVKLFNYVIQNMETKENVGKILEVQEFLLGSNTKLVMITYDSFLFDFDPLDGKETLAAIKEILERGGTKVKYKYGEDLTFLGK
jgi:hypothetical protein